MELPSTRERKFQFCIGTPKRTPKNVHGEALNRQDSHRERPKETRKGPRRHLEELFFQGLISGGLRAPWGSTASHKAPRRQSPIYIYIYIYIYQYISSLYISPSPSLSLSLSRSLPISLLGLEGSHSTVVLKGERCMHRNPKHVSLP